ncbi:LpxL/LpxP family Kdo(2)-lipid IV(A) lauroyl/palmitoleoyl acyltransferase [Hahella sp. KA22]|uniref:LpxL/LpxP family Kdo(2)-lipid IV(A) lauroyl/palmitoleoyl acyltransferase n=1 Tax=Hahella sp. KA22 TaxID=1628392 RepID=UPI001013704A|nr:LpxL/LpxP family Kdo(2)-lipid IV(A) lauroyl/palmitoleoyl acyltransferase [Hahella sp. KA22]QAY57719.1 LpxL/LpxP family Kdo(2)-lipid IV(A) lauroyl/palmitoleoyl acyltransferase [Hahella sp. KA22]
MSEEKRDLTYSDFIHPRYWPTWLGIALLWLIAHAPLAFQRALGIMLGRAAYYFLPKRRKIAEVNINLCFPELAAAQRQALVKSAFDNNAIGYFEAASAWFTGKERFRAITKAHGLENLQEAQAKGKGVILLGGHFTTLDLGGALFDLYSTAACMQRDHDNPLFNLVMTRARSDFCHPVMGKDDLRGLIRHLKAGGTIWYATDQDYGLRGSVFAPFFNVPAATITTTSRIAQKTGAPVVPFSHFRNENGGYDVYFEPALSDYPSGDDLADATATNLAIENAIRRYPAQYLWMHRRFKTEENRENHSHYGGK